MFLLALPPMPEPPPPRNAHPIVLVGGFTSWGREEAFGFRYWGGPGRDLQEDLKAQGHPCVTAAVGPLSSNWDRACELFAQLKGGRVDYGAAHAKTHGHARFGRTYAGLLPAWGTATLPRAHFLGHSQGGQTIRVLEHLLAHGAPEEATAAPDASPFFAGGKAWIASVTTLATPHQGTTLVWKREHLLGPAQKWLTLASRLSPLKVYDLKLDHWKLADPRPKAVFRHLEEAPLAQTRDFAPYDLSPEGAAALNAWVKPDPRVFHFTWSTAKTQAGPKGVQVPRPRMTLLWRQGARYLGSVLAGNGHAPLPEAWKVNDGVVNTPSQGAPTGVDVRPWDGTPRRGAWQPMGLLDGWDHSEILGIGPEHGTEVLPFYRRWAAFLAGLPD